MDPTTAWTIAGLAVLFSVCFTSCYCVLRDFRTALEDDTYAAVA